MPSSPSPLDQARADYEALLALNLSLDIQRGQPSDADFDLSDGLLDAVKPGDTVQDDIELRNYPPAGSRGLPSIRRLLAAYLDVDPENVLVWNNSSLELQGLVLTFALLHPLPGATQPGGWLRSGTGGPPKVVVTVPGYDRHFHLLETLGIEVLSVPMADDGPDVEAVAALAAADPQVRALLFVPTYSNPTGATISTAKAQRLASMPTAAPDFLVLADDAYRGHHLSEDSDTPVELLSLCREAGNPDRALVFASTSKITYAGAGLGFLATSPTLLAWLSRYLFAQSLGANKLEQARHARFLGDYPGGLAGLMRAHAALIAPKFAAVDEALRLGLGTDGRYAAWSRPRGGYFVSVDTVEPVAARVVALAKAAGVTLTPAGATFPGGQDPRGANIRIAPTRPPLEHVRAAMAALAVCIRLATEEHRAQA
ncbi:MAG: aminotransferase class I/II-fold pyridoxal phosphate-dependent enzyme [Dermatophilaceae bacterium]